MRKKLNILNDIKKEMIILEIGLKKDSNIKFIDINKDDFNGYEINSISMSDDSKMIDYEDSLHKVNKWIDNAIEHSEDMLNRLHNELNNLDCRKYNIIINMIKQLNLTRMEYIKLENILDGKDNA